MKKILRSLTVIFSMLLFINSVYADSFPATLVGDSTFTNEITIQVKVSGYTDNGSTCQGICGLQGNYSYDTSKLEILAVTALNDFRLTEGNGSIVLSRATGVGNGTALISFKFKNKGLSDGESTTFSMTNLIIANGDDEISGSLSKTITYVAPATTTTKKVEPTTTKKNDTTTTTKKTDDKKSDNTYLKELTISNGELTFSKDTLNYTVVVAEDIEEVIITAKAEDTKANVSGAGKYTLEDGENKIEIKVTAEDGSTKIYYINVTRDPEVPTEVITVEPTTINVIDTTVNNNNKNTCNRRMMPLIGCIFILVGIIVVLLFKQAKMKRVITD